VTTDRDEVLWRFVQDSEGRFGNLAAWLRQYPEYADDFLWISLHGGLAQDGSGASPQIALDAGTPPDIGRSLLAEMREIHARSRPPLHSLVECARELGVLPRELAAQIGVGLTVLTKLERRLVSADTVPERMVERLSAALKAGVAEVVAYLRLPATLSPAASYRAASAPHLSVREEPALCARYAVDGPPARTSLAGADEAAASGMELQASVRPGLTPTDEATQSFASAVRSAPDMTEAQKLDWLGESAAGGRS
jgi:hypothetical protein